MSFMFTLLSALFIPFLIVGFWRKRPVLAFILATLIMIPMTLAPGLIKTFQAMMIYGTGDPQLMAGGISEALVGMMLTLPIALPLLAVFQWAVRRHYKKKASRADANDAFM